jgi:hypothetical protein
MDEPEYETIRCRTCGGVAHPSSGCVYSSARSADVFIVCGPCTREAWRWIKGWTNQRGRGGVPSFYECVGRIGAPIVVEPVVG